MQKYFAMTQTRIEHALTISNLLITTIRRISFSISPNMLDDLGLNATLEWQCREFSILNGIPCALELAYDEKNLHHEIKIDFFRICQEALRNVMYHAEANKVTISIKEVVDKITLAVEDDGRGFVFEHQQQASGLIRMRELAASINGKLAIDSEPGKGTRVFVSIKK